MTTQINIDIKSQLAKLIATENITIQHNNVKTASFDTVNRILTLPIFKVQSGDVYDMLIAHECSHALYTPTNGWKKIADDWRKTAKALAVTLGNADIASDVYEDIKDGLYDTIRERMQDAPLTQQQSFDGLHNYAILLSTKAGEAQELRVAAEDSSDAENTYYWEGYEAGVDFAIDSLPNYNN